jgi:hypothetical protein
MAKKRRSNSMHGHRVFLAAWHEPCSWQIVDNNFLTIAIYKENYA